VPPPVTDPMPVRRTTPRIYPTGHGRIGHSVRASGSPLAPSLVTLRDDDDDVTRPADEQVRTARAVLWPCHRVRRHAARTCMPRLGSAGSGVRGRPSHPSAAETTLVAAAWFRRSAAAGGNGARQASATWRRGGDPEPWPETGSDGRWILPCRSARLQFPRSRHGRGVRPARQMIPGLRIMRPRIHDDPSICGRPGPAQSCMCLSSLRCVAR
jgi:hypothetical protein